MNPDADWATFSASHARELADRAHHPRQVCEEHFFQIIKVFIQQQASAGRYKCTYTVPGFTLGLPLYDADGIAAGLEKRFRREGWQAKAHGQRVEVGWEAAYKPVLRGLDGGSRTRSGR